jgi:hypothetical protein
MADIPASTATTATISVGGTFDNSLEVVGDHDWIRVQLTAGQQVSVELDGVSLADPFLTIRNSAGTVLFQDDDSGRGINSLIAFAAPSTGTYYIDVGASGNSQAGTYQLSVTPYVLPPLGTTDQFADWLVNGFWNGDSHHFPVTQGGTITVNLTALTAEGQSFAREALDLWSDIIGVHFQEVSSGSQITFDDLDQSTGAFTDGVWGNGITSSMSVNVSAQRLGSGTGLFREGLTTYLHEIGHALGLGHAGDYNGGTVFSRYPYQARYLNDSLSVSIMSYFDNGENSYYASQGFTNALVVTPQMADIDAVAMLYGLSTTTRTGNTTYGFHNSSGREEFDASLHPKVSYTIFDSGGIDTLDYSGFFANQLINLNPETFSNVGLDIGNVSIARGTIIENAIGGGGADTIIGNSADNVLTGNAGADTLTGGPGNDTFQDTAAGHNGDTVNDFGAGDRIVITDASLAGFTFSLAGHTLTYSGGSLTLSSAPWGHLVASAAAGGGVQLTIVPHVANDFNGDGISDVLWRNDDGRVTSWIGTSGGTLVDSNVYRSVGVDWRVAATGDFNGDGRSDILWHNADGRVTTWSGTEGGAVFSDSNSYRTVGTDWQVAGAGDINGDGIGDVLWYNADGRITLWMGSAGGAFVDTNAYRTVDTHWQVAGLADFNGDGRDDILWHNADGRTTEWLGNADGTFSDTNAYRTVGTDWQVAGTGDFNGDGIADILWHNADGRTTEWLGTASGLFSDTNAYRTVDPAWQVASIGDFNGDGRDDILWHNADGRTTEWLGNGDGSFADTNAYRTVDTHWHVQPPAHVFA